MAKKQNSGLGRGLDSLIPKIDDIKTDVEEGVSLEDLLKKTETEEKEEPIENKEEKSGKEEEKYEIIESIEDETEEDIEETKKVETIDETKSEVKEIREEEKITEEKEEKVEEKVEKKIVIDNKDEINEESSEYTNIFNNDDEKSEEKKDEDLVSKISFENIESSVNLKEEKEENIKIIKEESKIEEVPSLLSEKEERLVDEVIETVENNPRITLWSAKSAAVLRYLRKTEPEFSISNEASNLIDQAIAEKYPEIWTLFNHL